MRQSYFVGLDLGQRSDYSALAVVEEPLWFPSDAPAMIQSEERSGWISPSDLSPYDRRRAPWRPGPERPVLALRHLHRWPLGTPYPEIVQEVAQLLCRPPLEGSSVLLVDATGVGRPIVDLFDRARLDPMAITITGGSQVLNEGRELRVPKRDLAMAIAALLQSRRLTFAAALPLLAILRKELESFEVKITPQGHDQYLSWREGAHDDLVLAVAMATWYREWSDPAKLAAFDLVYAERRRPRARR
jgi:hypothetical protein